MDQRRGTQELSDDENNLQPPSKRVSKSRSPMTFPPPNPINLEGISQSDRESVFVGAASGLQLETAREELGDGLTVTLSHEMDVLYDPLEASGCRTRVTPQNEANNTLITEYDLPSLSQTVSRM